jgi:hypothetical protein
MTSLLGGGLSFVCSGSVAFDRCRQTVQLTVSSGRGVTLQTILTKEKGRLDRELNMYLAVERIHYP